MKTSLMILFASAALAALTTFAASTEAQSQDAGGVTKVPVKFSGGHETDPRDHGRPVVLIAAALGVPAEVFREAFSYVRPAPAGTEPDSRRVRENKDALLGALAKHGVTNERLDEVSNYYRYVRSRGELWPAKEAVANALVKNGVVTGFEILNGGSGYTSTPVVTIPGVKNVSAEATLSFGKVFRNNGSISSVKLSTRAQN